MSTKKEFSYIENSLYKDNFDQMHETEARSHESKKLKRLEPIGKSKNRTKRLNNKRILLLIVIFSVIISIIIIVTVFTILAVTSKIN